MLQHSKRYLCLAAFLAAGATSVLAQVQQWSTSGAWDILVDPEVGNGCYMEKRFDGGLFIQFGAAPERSGGFVAAYNPAWTFIEQGTTRTVRFEFPDVIFEGEVTGDIRNGVPGGRAFFNNPNLPFEFAKRKTKTIVGQSVGRIEVSLDGSFAAITEVRACQEKQPPPG